MVASGALLPFVEKVAEIAGLKDRLHCSEF